MEFVYNSLLQQRKMLQLSMTPTLHVALMTMLWEKPSDPNRKDQIGIVSTQSIKEESPSKQADDRSKAVKTSLNCTRYSSNVRTASQDDKQQQQQQQSG